MKFIFLLNNKEAGASTSLSYHTCLTDGAVLTLLCDPLEDFRCGVRVCDMH